MSNTKLAIWVTPVAVWSSTIGTFRDYAHAKAAHSTWWPNEQLAEVGGYFLLSQLYDEEQWAEIR